MTPDEILKVTEEVKGMQNLPNSRLIEIMDVLSVEFEITKQNIIDLTFYFDNIELLYNTVLKEYQKRQQ